MAGPTFSTKPSLVRSVKVRASRSRSRLVLRREDRLPILHEPADALAKLERSRRGNERAPGSDQERIARRLSQSRERPAHRRRAEAQAPRSARDAALCEQHVERDEQIEVGHAVAPYQSLAATWRRTHVSSASAACSAIPRRAVRSCDDRTEGRT